MLALISTLLSWLACRFRSRAELELELIALRYQVAVLNRQRRSRPRLYSVDRLLGVWFYPGVAALPPDHGSNGTQSDLEPVKLRNQV